MSGPVLLGHHQRVSNQPHALRWTTVGRELPVGRLAEVPGRFGVHLAAGVISRAVTEPHGVWVWLHESEQWDDWAPDLRAALALACHQVDQWVVIPDEDAVLAAIVTDIVHGELADFLQSHGGRIELREVVDGVVTVELGGACAHCSLAEVTLRTRVESAVRKRYPGLVELRDVSPDKPRQLFSFLRRA